MSKISYRIGDRHGRRTIVDIAPSRIYNNGTKVTYVKVRCDCGREDVVRLSVLIAGKANQCVDCSHLFNSYSKNNVSKQPWYSSWLHMMQRCHNPNNDRFYDYGGRGISVCKEWHDAWEFGKWAEDNGFKSGLQIDRIDNNGNYCPENCRWATNRENSLNRRNTIVLTIDHTSKPLSVWCDEYNVNAKVVRAYHVRKNLSFEDAFFLALGRKTCKEYQYNV